jgi:PPM family protein phosphatase
MTMQAMGIEVASATDIGPRRRTNADAYVIDKPARLIGIADGMGDTPRSAAVARAALEAVRELFLFSWPSLAAEQQSIGEAAERLSLGFRQANGRLYVPTGRSGRQGTTLVGAVLSRRHFCVAHAGDSRAYVLRHDARHLVQLTTDHTVRGRALARGVAPEVAAALPNTHALTQAIGLKPEVDLCPVVYRWSPGDTLLLCTDGVSDGLLAEEMTQALIEAGTLNAAAPALVLRAPVAYGRDNATAILARCSGETN